MRVNEWQPRHKGQLTTALQLPLRTVPDRTWVGAVLASTVTPALLTLPTSASAIGSRTDGRRCGVVAAP